MSPYSILMLCIAAALGAAIWAALASRKLPKATERVIEPPLPDRHPALGGGRPPARKSNMSFEKIKHTATSGQPITRSNASPLGQKKTPVFLTPSQIEHVNIIRKRNGKPPFNRAGLLSAIAHPWDRAEVRQPQTSTDWLSYLIVYEILSVDHFGGSVAGCGGAVIDRDLPYNGQGGEFAGAGASGDWSDTSAMDKATSVIAASPAWEMPSGLRSLSDVAPVPAWDAPRDPLSDPTSFKGSSDNAPSYSAPDPTPSVSDSSASYSSDSSSSFSPDTSSNF
jgi:hypothetical protein